MYFTKKNLDAQALNKWVAPENRLTPDEIIVERSFHRFLVSLNRPKPSPMALGSLPCWSLTLPRARPGGSESDSR